MSMNNNKTQKELYSITPNVLTYIPILLSSCELITACCHAFLEVDSEYIYINRQT